mgnify:CR=1 FL=1
MRTGPNLTDLNNRMIAWEFKRALQRGNVRLADAIQHANPQIPLLDFMTYRAMFEVRP